MTFVATLLAVIAAFTTATATATPTNIGELVHLTDPHMDLDYSIGAPTTCIIGSYLGTRCCHSGNIPPPTQWWHNHYDVDNRSRRWGEYTCDAPLVLFEHVVQWIANYTHNKSNRVDAVLYGGDTVGHNDFAQSTAANLHTMHTATQLFRTYLPHVSVISNQGNHDTYPIDQTPWWNRHKIARSLISDWSTLVVPPDVSTAASSSDQTFYHWQAPTRSPNLHIVSIDSLTYDTYNWFPSTDTQRRQAVWLRNVFDGVREQNRLLPSSSRHRNFVYLLGHIPPSGGESSTAYNRWLVSLTANYSDVVRTGFYGHSHQDQLYVYNIASPTRTPTQTPTQTPTKIAPLPPPALVAPSVMPDKRDPCFRIYQYDRINGTVLSYDQYCVDLEKTNQHNRFIVYLHYSTRKAENDWYPRPLSSEGIRAWWKRNNNTDTSSIMPQTLYCMYYYGIRAGVNASVRCTDAEIRKQRFAEIWVNI